MKKYLCDQMCGQLGRWLRTAGYDTVIIDHSMDDRKIFRQSVEEKRRLLSRDHYFKEIDPEEQTVLYLKGEFLEDWVEQLGFEGVDWLFSPFSRCIKCNTLLKKDEAPSKLLADLPEGVKTFWYCPVCQQLFWRGSHTERMEKQLKEWSDKTSLTIGLGGDLMIGRLVNDHLDRVPPSYVWGNLLSVLSKSDFNFVNLETTLTRSEKAVSKVFNFKADPEKVAVLKEGAIHGVNIANNHILDFSREGLFETLRSLDQERILHVGAGKNLKEAKAPLIFEKKGIKIGLLGCTDNEPSWRASTSNPGINFVEIGDLEPLRQEVLNLRKQVDLLILSIHWGPNMRKRPAPDFCAFAHELIDLGVDILHGHSAHLFQGVESYKEKLILYDTGELIDDYAVDPLLRNDRSFFFKVRAGKKTLRSLTMIPILISHFQVNISDEDEQLDEMKELCKEFDTYPVREGNFLHLKFR